MMLWKQGRRAAAAVSMLLLILTFPAYGTKQDVEDAKRQASAMEEEKQKVERTLQSLEGLKADTAAYVRELDVSLTALEAELDSLGGQILLKEEEIRQTKEQLGAAKETEERQYAAMKLRIRYMYEKGDASFMELLLGARDLSELLNRAEYISKISAYDRQQLDLYEAVRQERAEQEEKLTWEHQELLALQESTAAKQASVEALLGAKQTELAAYETQIASAQAQVDLYQQDIAAQEAKIQALEEEIQRKEEEARKKAEEERKKAQEAGEREEEAGKSYTKTDLGNISFIWPCPSSSRVTSVFGSRSSPMEGASTDHKGIDIGAGTGSSILAAADGVVLVADYSYSAGNYVTISHGGGISTVYMHCSRSDVSAGQTVRQGQVIGAVGSTGYSTGPHLHFGIRSGGAYVDPLEYVRP